LLIRLGQKLSTSGLQHRLKPVPRLLQHFAVIGTPSDKPLAVAGAPSNKQLAVVGAPSDKPLAVPGAPSNKQLAIVGAPSIAQLGVTDAPSNKHFAVARGTGFSLCFWLTLLSLPFRLSGAVKNGIDVLIEQEFAPLAGKRIGLITNHSGLTYEGRRTIDVLANSGKVKLVAIFTPEHGLTGAREGESVAPGKDAATGLPVYSLYQEKTRRPTPEMLHGLDALVYDIQDAGARFYTYITTLGYTLEEAGRNHLAYYVLDRPNPIGGVAVEGPVLESKYFSMVGYMRMPIRHGMTVGELAQLFNGENKLGADLHVIAMQGWRRSMFFDETGQEWIEPSPNLRNLTEAILYPGTCLLESTQVSVGRGTDTPFQIVGAPWFQAKMVADWLNALHLPGVSFLARRFRPTAAPYKDRECAGVEVQLLDRQSINSVRTGLALVAATLKFHPGKFDLDKTMRLLGSGDVAAGLKRGESLEAIEATFQPQLREFLRVRERYLLYR